MAPSFSLIIETANLRLAHVDRLRDALASIAKQEPSPRDAEQVVLLEDGELPEDLLTDLRVTYPWLTTRRIPPGLGYGDQKAISTELAQSDIVVVADPDCIYEPGWLGAILDAFTADPSAGAVAGETTIDVTGPFTLAAALFYFFPRFSMETEVSPARGFYLNNVAFRRAVVREHPIPVGLPVQRGQNVIYSRILDEAGVAIRRQPRARAYHAPPEDLAMAIRVLFWTGRDTPRFDRLASPREPFSGDYEPYGLPRGRLGKIVERLRTLARHEPAQLAWLPLALPIAALVWTSFFAGRLVERLAPAQAVVGAPE